MAAKTLTVARNDWVSAVGGGVSKPVRSKTGCLIVVVVWCGMSWSFAQQEETEEISGVVRI